MKRLRRLALVGTVAALGTLGALAFGGAPASGTVVVHPSLTVTVDGTSIACHWTIDKSASLHGTPVSSLTLAVNEVATIGYTVTVTKTCTNDVHGTVSGQGNPDSVAVTLDSVNAVVSGCTYDSGANTFSCNYDGHPTTTADGTVTATATYHDLSTATGSAPYSFSGVQATEDSVDIFDVFQGVETNLATHLATSAVYRYSHDVSFSTCGHFSVDNTARVQDGTVLGSKTVSIAVTVPCPQVTGCTLTPGYWKTHSKYGPAPSDPAWNLVPGGLGPDTPFFLASPATWYQVINTPPAGGNAYYILSFQYIAARLNILDGASSTSAVDSAIAAATTFFQTYTPAQAAAFASSSTARKNAISWATTLGNYNSGLIGPGHCSE